MSSTSELQFIETDAGQIYDFIMYVLENGVTEELYPGDERRIFGETLATLVVALYSTMNDSATMRTREEMEAEIRGLQQLLAATDYKALKHADGALTDEEYEPTRAKRAEYRQQINDLQAAIETLETTEGQVVDNE